MAENLRRYVVLTAVLQIDKIHELEAKIYELEKKIERGACCDCKKCWECGYVFDNKILDDKISDNKILDDINICDRCKHRFCFMCLNRENCRDCRRKIHNHHKKVTCNKGCGGFHCLDCREECIYANCEVQ